MTLATTAVVEAATAPVPPLRRIAIVNRGEAAMRLIHAVREYNEEHGAELRTVALYTAPDRRALFVREADEAVSLGPAFVTEPGGGRHSAYVDLERLETGLREARPDAAWVGWGFVSEQPAFAELCERLGVMFMGPSAAAMSLLGDKIAAKRIAEECGIPVGDWSGGPLTDLEDATAHASRLGYPHILKAAAGGGGRGMRTVRAAGELAGALASARSEAGAAFGDETIFMERLLAAGRHVEVQVVGDGAGTTWAVGVRDCSVQRRHQKVMEESASTALDAAAEQRLRAWAALLCTRAAYRGAGTVEFLLDPASGDIVFMEVNARLQVEHPVTEMTTGVDLVKLQIHLAMGGRLEGEPPPAHGHAVEVRLCAEDPDNGFAPAPGVVELLRLPFGPGIRVDTGVAEGDAIAPEFDSMIAKLIAWGPDRDSALARLRRALGETAVVLRGGTTNRAFLLDLLSRPEVRDGVADIGWLDRTGSISALPRPHADIALLLAAVDVDEDEFDAERAAFFNSAARGRPQVSDRIGRIIELSEAGNAYRVRLDRRGPTAWSAQLDGRSVELEVERIGPHEARVRCQGAAHRALCVTQGSGFLIEVDGSPHRIERDAGGLVRAPSPAVVASIRVAPGDSVAEGDVLAVLEAMKMEMPLCAPYAGTVTRILVMRNVQVDSGAPVVELEPNGRGSHTAGRAGHRVTLREAATRDGDLRAAARRALELLRSLMLGFDVDAGAASAALADCDRAEVASGDADEWLWRGRHAVLDAFADVCVLSRRRPEGEEEEEIESSVRTAQERLFEYLRALDVDPSPPAFAEELRRALAHYGVTGLDRGPALERALFWIVRAHQHSDVQLQVVTALLEQMLASPAPPPGVAGAELRALLERIQAAARSRHPVVADLAREVRHRYFDQPLMDRALAAAYEEVEAHLAHLAEHPRARDRAARVAALVECPQPLHNLLTGRFALATPAIRGLMLEVMTRRYYRIRDIGEVRVVNVAHGAVAVGTYLHRGRRTHVVTTFAVAADLTAALAALRPLAEAVAPGEDVVVDAYVWRDGPELETEKFERATRAAVTAAGLPRSVRRVVVAETGPGRGLGMAASQHLSYRRAGGRYREEPLYRSLHPMMADRLRLWRFGAFDLERLPSVEDVYAFHCVARSNPADERLFAIAEVRDVAAVRDEAGRVVALPRLERMLLEALASIRAWQSRRPPGKRLQWNRVVLYVWPELRLDAAEIGDIAQRIAPETEGLGLERIVVRARIPDQAGKVHEIDIHFLTGLGTGAVSLQFHAPATHALQPLDEYRQKVVLMRRRGLVYPYEIVDMLTPAEDSAEGDFPAGDFVEHDLDEQDALVPVERGYGRNTANLVVGVIRNRTRKHPEGMTRVIVLGDPSRSLGAIAEPECRRIIAALDLAERMDVPVEWFAVTAGAKIAMDSGTENMDWIAHVLRRIVLFTQAGGEINLVVNGINVGAQPYWNAEATMLMHTRGILVMTPDGAMVLTGKQALDYSGSVSADDNFDIGGHERVMGPNGQAQYWAPDLSSACQLLLRHYEHTYRAPGERFPRRAATADPFDRDAGASPHPSGLGSDFARTADIFTETHNPGRKKPFDIRAVMGAVADQDHVPLERWAGMRHAENAVVWDVHLGGIPVCMLGLESRPLARVGFVPADGPDMWTPGTLFPLASKKIARAINAASDNRPVVVLANLSGFDGSPESMRRLQLEFGAEIGRAVVNFRGPMVFCVISRYHGGAFVVFSAALNESLEVAAVEGSFASVIGGAPAAAVVFAREVDTRTKLDPRVVELAAAVSAAAPAGKAEWQTRLATVTAQVRSEKLGEVAAEFDAVHTVQRAQQVGSVDRIIPAATLRPYLIDAVERGMRRELAQGR